VITLQEYEHAKARLLGHTNRTPRRDSAAPYPALRHPRSHPQTRPTGTWPVLTPDE
jgi:hypothetical protein